MSNSVITWNYKLTFSFKSKKYINVVGEETIKYDTNHEPIVDDLTYYLKRVAVGEWELKQNILLLSSLEDCYKVKMMFDSYITEYNKIKKG